MYSFNNEETLIFEILFKLRNSGIIPSQELFTCSKSVRETLEKGVNYVRN